MVNREHRARQRRSGRADARYDSPTEYSSSSFDNTPAYPAAPPRDPLVSYSPAPASPGRTESSASRSASPAPAAAPTPAPARRRRAASDTEDDDAPDGPYAPVERRGKKGLMQAELSHSDRPPLYGVANDSAAEGELATQSDSEPQVNDGGETEDESEEEASQSDDPGQEAAEAIKASFDPNIVSASDLLQEAGAQPGAFGYARLTGAGKGAVDYLVRKTSVIIGRAGFGADCQVKSEGAFISRQHAKLFWVSEEDQWAITCLSRKNGLLVDGTPVVPGAPPMPLQSRNLIEVGDVAFFFLTATGTVFRFPDLTHVESEIARLREAQEGAMEGAASSDEESYDRYSRPEPLNGRAKLQERLEAIRRAKSAKLGRQDHSVGRSELSGSSRRPSPGYADEVYGGLSKSGPNKSKHKGKRGKSSRSNAAYDSGSERERAWEDDQEDDARRPSPRYHSEDQEEVRSARRKSSKHSGHVAGKRKQAPDPPSSQGKKKKKKKERPVMKREDEFKSKYPSSYFRETWNKKERLDFGRALFAIGVDAIRDDRGDVLAYDWGRFRNIAELPKKPDEMLEEYYKQLMSDVHGLLDEEEREKQTKGPRTKHKLGCDCIVCENTRKSRMKKRGEDGDFQRKGKDDVDDDGQVKSTGRPAERLVGLVTAQKLRVRLSIHEAARQIDSEAGVAVMQKLRSQRDSPPDLPSWWRNGLHDRDLMVGTARHGVGQWAEIWGDDALDEFVEDRMKNEDLQYPTPQAAMKRLREISSAINAEIRRIEKRTSRRGPEKSHRFLKKKKQKKPTAKKPSRQPEVSSGRRKKPGRRRADESGDEYEEEPTPYLTHPRRTEGETTAESGSEDNAPAPNSAALIETEDEEEEDVQLEVEEMEIEEEEEDDDGGAGLPKAPGVAAADISTDDEGEEEVIQYETASDTGTE